MPAHAQPLVSIGIPTYSRPEGLRRTLECITAQTYRNLEIIVSDNSSPGLETQRVVESFMSNDRRVSYHRQNINRGAFSNFKFVLKASTGQYFMWAADDDEWRLEFVETCLENMGMAGSVMTGINVKNRISNQSISVALPSLARQNSVFTNTLAFLDNIQPSLFYGLHLRNSILFCLTDEPFDFYDCYFIIHQILYQGFHLVSSPLYTAGIDSMDYIKKPANPMKGRLFEYDRFYLKTAFAITNCPQLCAEEKARLLKILATRTDDMLIAHEKGVSSMVPLSIRWLIWWAKRSTYKWVVDKSLG